MHKNKTKTKEEEEEKKVKELNSRISLWIYDDSINRIHTKQSNWWHRHCCYHINKKSSIVFLAFVVWTTDRRCAYRRFSVVVLQLILFLYLVMLRLWRQYPTNKIVGHACESERSIRENELTNGDDLMWSQSTIFLAMYMINLTCYYSFWLWPLFSQWCR